MKQIPVGTISFQNMRNMMYFRWVPHKKSSVKLVDDNNHSIGIWEIRDLQNPQGKYEPPIICPNASSFIHQSLLWCNENNFTYNRTSSFTVRFRNDNERIMFLMRFG